MKRREFITLIGGAAVTCPFIARAQQQRMPVIGHLHPASPEGSEESVAAFRQGLKEEGYLEGQNVMIEYRWAHGDIDRSMALMIELAKLRVDVLAVFGTAARMIRPVQATGVAMEIPIVFSSGGDPVALGLVASLNRPGGKITGTTSIGIELGPKRLELVQALVPTATTVALLTNPRNPGEGQERSDIEKAAQSRGWRLQVVRAASASEFESAFATVARQRIGALIIAVDTFFYGEIINLAALAAQYSVPTIAPLRAFATAGGLMSFGANIPDVVRQAGVYVGKVLKGAKPADLPVLQPTRFELVVNLKAAQMLKLDVPTSVLLRADEVIE